MQQGHLSFTIFYSELANFCTVKESLTAKLQNFTQQELVPLLYGLPLYSSESPVFVAGSVGDHCCTCPIGERGDCCKHVVAMLLVFKNSQEVIT